VFSQLELSDFLFDSSAFFGLAFLEENEELKRTKIPYVIKYVYIYIMP